MARRINISALVTIGGAVASSLSTAVGTARTRFRSVGSAIDMVQEEQRQLRREIERMTDAGRDVTQLQRRYDQLGRSMDRLRARQERLNDVTARRQRNATARADARGQLMDAVAIGATVAAPAVIAAGFEQQMADVGAVAGATREELAAMTAEARRLGSQTQYSAVQAGEGMEFLAMSGFRANDAIAAMPGLLDLAKVGSLELGRASDIATNTLSGFNMRAGEMDRVGDVFANTITTSNTTVEQLGDTMSYVAPVAGALRVSLEETAAAAGLLGNAGIQGSQAGTALRAILTRLSAPTDAAAEALAALGVNTKDADGNLRALPDVLADINTATADMGTAVRAESLRAIFGVEALSAATVLLEQAGTGALHEYSVAVGRAGTASEVAAAKADTAIGDWRGLNSALEEGAIVIGSVLLPSVREIVQTVTTWTRGVAALAEEHPEATRVIVATGAAVGALTATLIVGRYTYLLFQSAWLAGQAVMAVASVGIGTVTTAIRAMTLALATNPVGLTIAAIALAAGLIITHWEPIKEFVGKLWEDVGVLVQYGLDFIREHLSWTPLGMIITHWEPIRDFMFGLWGGIADLVDSVIGGIVSSIEWVGDKVSWLRGADEEGRVDQYGNPIVEGRVDERGNPLRPTPIPDVQPREAGGTSTSLQIGSISVQTSPGQDEELVARRTVDEIMRRLGMDSGALYDGATP